MRTKKLNNSQKQGENMGNEGVLQGRGSFEIAHTRKKPIPGKLGMSDETDPRRGPGE